MTPAEAQEVLTAAKQSASLDQWDDIVHLLRNTYDLNLLTATDQGDAAYLLGLAYRHTGSSDGAYFYFTEATSSAGEQYRAEAQKHLSELDRHDAAIDAELDDRVDQDEVARVLAAGDDAQAAQIWDEAMTHYRAAYDGTADVNHRARAALGIATVLAHQNSLTEAAQFAEYVLSSGTPSVADGQSLLTWIHSQQGAATAIEDGTTVDEYAATMEAGRSAYFAGSVQQAHDLFVSVLESHQVGNLERAKAAFNAAKTDVLLGQEAESRQHFAFVLAHGDSDMVANAQTCLNGLDEHDTAMALAAELS